MTFILKQKLYTVKPKWKEYIESLEFRPIRRLYDIDVIFLYRSYLGLSVVFVVLIIMFTS